MSVTTSSAVWRGRPRQGGRPLATASVVVLAGLIGVSLLLAADAPIVGLWLLVCALATVPVVAWFAAQGRLFEPLPLLLGACAIMFVLRPLQLMLEWRDLYSHFFPEDPVRRMVLLEGQEIARFVGGKLEQALEPAFARALGTCALFVVGLLAGYRFGPGARVARRLTSIRGPAHINLSAAIGLSLVIGLIAQVAIIARAGGPRASLESASDQVALGDSFVLFLLAGFAFAGVIAWAAWRRPATRAEWAGLLASVGATCAFALLAGSRARVFVTLVVVAVIVHYLRRRWRARELVIVLVAGLAFVSAFAVFREVAEDRPLGRSVSVAAEHVLDPRVLLNDNTSWDHVLYATSIYGRSRPHEHGRFLLDGARSFVPSVVDPNKPEGGDIAFRKVVWQEEFGAGRPPTGPGDLYIDFGFPGVAIGALVLGFAARALLGLLGGAAAGREYRVALYALLLVVLYELVVGTFSLALGLVLTLVVPFLVAVHGFGRLPWAALPPKGGWR